MGERRSQDDESPDEPRDTRRLTVREAAAALGITEAAVRNRINRSTLRSEREGGTVYVVFASDEPSPNIGEPTDEPSADHRLIESHESRIESLERQLAAERDAHGESRRIIAGLVQRIPELESPPQSAQEAAESASEGESRGGEENASEERTEAQRAPWWRRLLGVVSR